MKTRLLTLLFCLLVGFLLISCSTPRKLRASKEEKTKVDQAIQESNTGASSTFVDTTKTNGVEVTYTKIEYYPPKANEEPTPEPEGQVTPGKMTRPEGSRNKELAPAKKQRPNKGPIKSIEQLTVKQNSEEKGVSQRANASAKEETTTTDTDKTEANTEQLAADPYRWRYILAILVIVIVAGVWLKKTKIGKTIISFIKKIFVHN